MDYEAREVGTILQSVPIGDMIKSYGVGIADAQWALDQKSMETALALIKAKVSLLGQDGKMRKHSLLDLGFSPTFYQFKEATIEINVSLTMRVEQSFKLGLSLGARHATKGKDPTPPVPDNVTPPKPVVDSATPPKPVPDDDKLPVVDGENKSPEDK